LERESTPTGDPKNFVRARLLHLPRAPLWRPKTSSKKIPQHGAMQNLQKNIPTKNVKMYQSRQSSAKKCLGFVLFVGVLKNMLRSDSD
jgi:hypothetical protein